MKLVYFAWVRERIGVPEEDVALPEGVATVGALLDWLRTRGEQYDYALAEPSLIRVAVDHVHVASDTPLGEAREVALFPPMTGG
ncbi:molybdopterin converting factor subunit 1, partial [Bauldia litoralis]|uniref:molybdopterin converting factor subunit 1 n=1 Tax=Bauldia litoralis TaxID=665467 RepID=UPI003265852F